MARSPEIIADSPAPAVVDLQERCIPFKRTIPLSTALTRRVRSVQLRASSNGKLLMAVFSLILLFATGRCQLTTKEDSLPAVGSSVARVPVVGGDSSAGTSRVTISSWSRGAPEFAVYPSARLLSIAFYDQKSTEPLWILVSSHFSPAEGQVVGGSVHHRDDRHQDSSEQRSIDLAREAGVLTSGFTYGVIPSGFQQLVPSTGDPERLKNGGDYLLTMNGDVSVRLTFKAKRP